MGATPYLLLIPLVIRYESLKTFKDGNKCIDRLLKINKWLTGIC